MAWHITIPPNRVDPPTLPPQITPFGVLYALHDGLVRRCRAKLGNSLPESWESADDLVCQQPGGLLQARIERVSQAVPEEVEAEHSDEDRQPGE
jgi:hypothetical protein